MRVGRGAEEEILWADSLLSWEPPAGLDPMTPEITIWAETKSRRPNKLSHPGALDVDSWLTWLCIPALFVLDLSILWGFLTLYGHLHSSNQSLVNDYLTKHLYLYLILVTNSAVLFLSTVCFLYCYTYITSSPLSSYSRISDIETEDKTPGESNKGEKKKKACPLTVSLWLWASFWFLCFILRFLICKHGGEYSGVCHQDNHWLNFGRWDALIVNH